MKVYGYQDPSTRQQIAAARERLLRAWRAISLAADDPSVTNAVLQRHDLELRDAMTVAAEWGLDPKATLIEAGSLR